MIRLEVEGYCQQCLDFSPEVTKAQKLMHNDGITITDTIIKCEHSRRCAGIKRYLEKHVKGENKQ